MEAYKNSQIYKEKIKVFHDKYIVRKEFQVGDKVLLYNSRLRLIRGKLRSRWEGYFYVTNIFLYGVAEIQEFPTGRIFKVNEHHLKVFHEGIEEKIQGKDETSRCNLPNLKRESVIFHFFFFSFCAYACLILGCLGCLVFISFGF